MITFSWSSFIIVMLAFINKCTPSHLFYFIEAIKPLVTWLKTVTGIIRRSQLGLSRLRWALFRHFCIWSTILYYQHSQALNWVLGRIFLAFSETFQHIFHIFHALNAIFVFARFSVKPSNTMLWIMNNFTLSPDWLTVAMKMHELWSF